MDPTIKEIYKCYFIRGYKSTLGIDPKYKLQSSAQNISREAKLSSFLVNHHMDAAGGFIRKYQNE